MEIFLVSYCLVAVLYLSKGVQHVNKNVKALLKCLPIFMLIGWFAYQWQYNLSGSDVWWRCGGKLSEGDEAKFSLAFLALIFSVIGDACLVGHYKISFPLGVVAFTLAQVLYSYIFHSLTSYNGNLSLVHMFLSVLIVLLLDLGVLFLVYARMKSLIRRIEEQRHRNLVIYPIVVYFGLISVMLWTSLNLFMSFYNFPALLGLLGGALFYVSDLFIALSAIYDFYIFKRRILVMTTYYGSQFFITLCILSICSNSK